MQVQFLDLTAQQLFNSNKELSRSYGADNARVIRRRLDDLRAVPTLADGWKLPGRLEELRGNRKGQLSMRLVGGQRLVFKPHPNPAPIKADGRIDYEQIRSITILEVTNYHD